MENAEMLRRVIVAIGIQTGFLTAVTVLPIVYPMRMLDAPGAKLDALGAMFRDAIGASEAGLRRRSKKLRRRQQAARRP